MTEFPATKKSKWFTRQVKLRGLWRCSVYADCPGISQRTSLVTWPSAGNVLSGFTRNAWTSLMKLTLNLLTVGFVVLAVR